MKNYHTIHFFLKEVSQKIISMMKLSCIISIISILNVGATAYSKTTGVSAQMTNITEKSDIISVETLKQGIAVTGIILDGNGDPIPGVNVVIKGTSTGGVTDIDGRYSISVPSSSSVLVFSFVGYETQELLVGDKRILDIVLNESAQALGEVVVTALGMSRDKKALGYAMTELKGVDIARANVANPINGLQGKVAGVQINMGNSGPQSAQRIIIRGNSTLRENNQPIFVVDGIIIDNELNQKGETVGMQDFGNDLKNLNSDDFETVSVLKGAAATALYGSRAANGVILITTKKGKKGEGIGVDVSHTQTWEVVYKFPDFQNEYGTGVLPAWPLNPDGSDSRNVAAGRSFGPKFDGQPFRVDGVDLIYSAKEDNLKQMYKTGRYINTNVAIHGGDEKGTFRFSYSNLQSEGVTINNEYDRNSFSLNATRQISRFIEAESGFVYATSKTRNPTFQGGSRNPVYDFAYSVPREYDTEYWMNNYKSANGDGYNPGDPYGYSANLFEFLENNYYEKLDNIRGYLNLNFNLTHWLKASLKGDLNKVFVNRENQVLATGQTNYDGAKYEINDRRKDQYKVTAMLSAFHDFDNELSISGSAAVERWDTKSAYHNTVSTNGLRNPGQFDMTNSTAPATTTVRDNTDRKRINSIYAFVNMSYKNQLYLDLTGRNDWSSALIYKNGGGTVSYFYPSISSSWIFSETFRSSLPEFISFSKLRASYAIVGNDCEPYLTTATGFYKFSNTFVNPNDGRNYPYYEFDSNSLPNLALKPEKQHSVELGLDMRFLQNRAGFDFAWYRTNTKNQIMQLAMASETGVGSRWINAGNMQNTGIEIQLNGTPIRTNDWEWNLMVNFTKNWNKVIELTDGISKYKIGSGTADTEAWATVGGAYGDIYTNYAYARDDQGRKLLNESGGWQRAGKSTLIGSLQPDFLGGFSSTLSYKAFSLNIVADARFGGDIYSSSYGYGTSSGTLKSTLFGRDQEHGGLMRIDKKDPNGNRTVYDGMIPDGVFAPNTVVKIGEDNSIDISGKTYKEAMDLGAKDGPVAAHDYYDNLASWTNGIREEFIVDCSWVAIREIALWWNMPKKWSTKLYMQNVNIGLVVRNVGYLYNSLPNNIHPEGLASNKSWEYSESGGAVYSRNIGFSVNVSF